MKKLLYLLLSGLVLCQPALAKHNCGCDGCDCHIEHKLKQKQKSGFVDTAMQPVSLSTVQNLPDGAYVAVIGYLTKRIGPEEYNFTDGMDNIAVEIKDKRWKGQKVTPKNKIILKGIIDKNPTDTMIEVKSVKIIN